MGNTTIDTFFCFDIQSVFLSNFKRKNPPRNKHGVYLRVPSKGQLTSLPRGTILGPVYPCRVSCMGFANGFLCVRSKGGCPVSPLCFRSGVSRGRVQNLKTTFLLNFTELMMTLN